MRKLEVLNVPKKIYANIQGAATRSGHSVEEEVCLHLNQYFGVTPLTSDELSPARERWRRDVGCRLLWLQKRLAEDEVIPAGNGIAYMARHSGESTAGRLIDCQDGRCDLDFRLADRLAASLDFSADWLLCGTATPFPVTDLNDPALWNDFFIPYNELSQYSYELMRVNGLHNDGIILCFRRDVNGHMLAGTVSNLFRLTTRIQNGCNLTGFRHFFSAIKYRCLPAQLYSSEYVIRPDNSDFITSSVGQHHPLWFINLSRRCPVPWLKRLMAGQRPFPGFTGYDDELIKISDVSFFSKDKGPGKAPG